MEAIINHYKKENVAFMLGLWLKIEVLAVCVFAREVALWALILAGCIVILVNHMTEIRYRGTSLRSLIKPLCLSLLLMLTLLCVVFLFHNSIIFSPLTPSLMRKLGGLMRFLAITGVFFLLGRIATVALGNVIPQRLA